MRGSQILLQALLKYFKPLDVRNVKACLAEHCKTLANAVYSFLSII